MLEEGQKWRLEQEVETRCWDPGLHTTGKGKGFHCKVTRSDFYFGKVTLSSTCRRDWSWKSAGGEQTKLGNDRNNPGAK